MDRLREWQRNALADVEKIGAVLGQRASDNDLCGQYERALSDANDETTVLVLAGRENVDLWWDETYTVQVRRTESGRSHPSQAAVEAAARAVESNAGDVSWAIRNAIENIDSDGGITLVDVTFVDVVSDSHGGSVTD